MFPENFGHLLQSHTDVPPLFLRRPLFPEFRFLSVALTVDVAPSVLVPAPQWFFERGRSKELLCSNPAQPRGDNSHSQGDLVTAKELAEGLEGASASPDIVSPKKQTGAVGPEVAFEGGDKIPAPVDGRVLPQRRVLTGPVVCRQPKILWGRNGTIHQRICPSVRRSLIQSVGAQSTVKSC